MGKRTLVLIVAIGACLGLLPVAAGASTQDDYTVPAREKLFSGTRSGLTEAYQILQQGLDDQDMTGDVRELKFFHALARMGLLVFDTNDVTVNTSLVELGAPYGVTVSGDKFFVPDPCDPNDMLFMPSDSIDPNVFRVNLPVDPCDPNCYLVQSGLDQSTLDATATAINTIIIPEINSIVSELNSILDWPTPFRVYLLPSETGLLTQVEVDYAEVLALKGLLAGVKASLRGTANPAYDFLINPHTSPFSGRICDIFYEFNGILSAYPNLLKVLPTSTMAGDGAASLALAKLDVMAGIDAYIATMNYIKSETDPQQDDFIYIDPNVAGPLNAQEAKLLALKTSLQMNTVATYAWLTTRTYTAWQSGALTGPLTITYDVTGYDVVSAQLSARNPDDPFGPAVVWDSEWGDIYENNQLEIDFEYGIPGTSVWFWGTLRGTVSGTLITNATFSYEGWGSGGWISLQQDLMTIAGPSATNTVDLRFNLNPIFAGTVNPRDLLPQFDPNNDPVPGTFGHGLGDDATLGGILPDMTQRDWMPQGYEVWGFNDDAAAQVQQWLQWEGMEGDPRGCTRLGQSAGQTMAFSGTYDNYLILTLGEVLIDSLRASDGQYVSGVVFDYIPTTIEGAPDGQFVAVGENEVLLGSPLFGPNEYTGAVGVDNTDGWTGITVITGTGGNVVTATAAPTHVTANTGHYITITITVTDASGNPVEGIPPGEFEVTAPGSGTDIAQPSAATDASGQTTAMISSTEVEFASVSVALYGQTFSDLVTIEFTSGDAAKLAFVAQPEGPYAAGATINAIPQVQVQDAAGNPVTASSANITVAIGANPGSGALSGTTTVAAVSGLATFSDLSINKAGAGYTLTATATGLTAAESDPFTIIPDSSTSQLVFVASPGETPALATLTPNPTVEIRDTYGNTVTSADDEITVAIKSGTGDPAATLSGTTAVAATNGVATYDDLKINRAADGYRLTATAAGLSGADSASFNITAEPALVIAKADSADPADAGDEVVYTIVYGNQGLADATDVVIVETLPADLVFVSADNGGIHNAGTITWNVADIPAETATPLEVSFTASIAASLSDGGTVTNSNLTIDCDETDPVQAPAESTAVNDTQGPVITPLIPAAGDEEVELDSIVKLRITDASGVDYDGSTVTIRIEDDLIYDGANEAPLGEYDSTGSVQAVRGICRRTGTATAYTFTFVPSTSFGHEKKVDVVVEAADEAGNAGDLSYYFWTQLRSFGANAKVNSDSGTLVQDNPATVADSQGNVWVVWDQTNAAGDRDVYVGALLAGTNSFAASVPVADSNNNEQDPVVAVDADDVAYVAWQQDDPNGYWDIYLSSSTDGTTWSTPVKLSAGDPCNLTDQTAPALAIDTTSAVPNRMYAAWQSDQTGNQDIWLGTSTGGSTWDETQITDNTADQMYPVVAVDENRVAYVLWTDARDSGTTGTDIWGASSDTGPWTPIAVVDAAGDQSGPAGATSEILHLGWGADVNGFGEILYANDAGGLPLLGTSIVDATEPNAVQRMPALAVSSTGDRDVAFACWEDGRNVNLNTDTDIYFAESSSPFGTNILVNDDSGTSRQTNPAIGLDGRNPYMVWVDGRNGNDDIYYAGATALEPVVTTVTEVNDVYTVQSVTDPNLQVVVSDDALPEDIAPDDITISEVSNMPEVPPSLGGFGLVYDFGPSGTVFDEPVTIRVPLDPDAPVYTVYNVYRYDPGDLTSPQFPWTEEGIHNPATKSLDGTYLEVEVDHFSVYGTGGYVAYGGGGGGGGCALAPWSDAGPMEFILPFVLFAAILSIATAVDLRRRRSGNRAQ